MQTRSESLKAFKIESSFVKILRKTFDRLVAQTLCRNYSRQELFQRSNGGVTALAFRAGCVMLNAGQFQNQEQKISLMPP